MKYILAIIYLLTFSILSSAQVFNFGAQEYLNSNLAEVSGVLYLNGKVIVHNDSGGDNVLYEIDASTGEIERSVTINNATNIDWEDICADDTYIYIADIGNNNSGNRQNLVVYRVLIADYENTSNSSVNAESIPFKYQDQTDFTSSADATDYDAEAIIAYNDSLYIFTKNWLSYTCNIYALPKMPSQVVYDSKRVDSFVANGLVTGAAYNSNTHDITLTAYNLAGGVFSSFAFIIKITSFYGNHFSEGLIVSREFSNLISSSPQIEGVAFIDDFHFYLVAEQVVTSFFTLSSWIATLEWDGSSYPVSLNEEMNVHPNPANNVLYFSGNTLVSAIIYNSTGQLLMQSDQNPVDISTLKSGLLIIRFMDQNGQLVSTKIIMKK